MIEIIRRSEQKEKVTYSLEFRNRKHRDAGHTFPCDENGKVNLDTMHPLGITNYIKCALGEEINLGIHKSVTRWIEPSIGRCHCSKEISLGNFTNECSCGRLYNWCGQELAPREEWEEEMYDEYRDDYIDNY